jgi:hypothetical protein
MVVTAGDFWDITNPKKPFGEFDPDSRLTFRLTVADIFENMGSPYGNHTIELPTDSPLEIISPGSHVDGVIDVTIGIASGAEYALGTKYPFTLRAVAQDGQQDDRTLWLKIKSL